MKPQLVAWVSLLLVVVAPTAVLADEVDADAEMPVVTVPPECKDFQTEASGEREAWEAVLSFAACIQDTRVGRVVKSRELQPFVEELHEAIVPSLTIYMAVVNEAPDPIKLRAAYAIGLGQVALITRARLSVPSRKLRDELDQYLLPNARLAYLVFVAIERIAEKDPSIVAGAVNQNMVARSRELAASLRAGWAFPVLDEEQERHIAGDEEI